MDTLTAIQTLTAHLGGVARDENNVPVQPDLSKIAVIEAITLALNVLKASSKVEEVAKTMAPVVPAEPIKIAPPPAVKK